MFKYIYTIEYSSVPGMYAQYNGEFNIRADDDEEAFEQAFFKLKRDCFRDRSSDMWKFKITNRITTL